MYKVIKNTGIKLYSYFKPSNDNLIRTLGFVNAMLVVPTDNFLLPRLFIKNDGPNTPHDNLTSNLAAVAVVNILSGIQDASTQMLSRMLLPRCSPGP